MSDAKFFSCSEYHAAEVYWNGVSADDDGMLGGLTELSSLDAADSRLFIKSLLQKFRLPTGRVLDCGAGIGRVTKQVLSKYFDHVDLVDVTQKFLDKSVSYLGTVNSKVERRICCGLQNLNPEPGRYNMIWIQWVASHLIDADLIAFLKRCHTSLSPDGGIIVLKENISKLIDHEFDEVDHSWTRSRRCLLNVFQESELNLISERVQRRFPESIYEVRMFALQ